MNQQQPQQQPPTNIAQTAALRRPLTILALHGFRQNATQFKGRLRALQRKLAGIATFVFLDAPYVLPLWYKPPAVADAEAGVPYEPYEQQQGCSGSGTDGEHVQQQQQQQQQQHGQHTRPPERQAGEGSSPSGGLPAPPTRAKRAWMLSEQLLAAQPQLQALFERCQLQQGGEGHAGLQQPHSQAGSVQDQHGWELAPAHIATEAQLMTQALGWQASWATIQAALSGGGPCQPPQEWRQDRAAARGQQQEPAGQQPQPQPQHVPAIDGLLGFSQGAAVAAVVAALCQQGGAEQGGRAAAVGPAPLPRPAAAAAAGAASDQQQQRQQVGSCRPQQAHCLPPLKFVILASGYVSPAPEHAALLRPERPLALPSLHLYAAAHAGGADRQVAQQQSEALAACFDPGSRRLVGHGSGHLVPSDAGLVQQMREFLQQFAVNDDEPR